MSTIDERGIIKVINETLGIDGKKVKSSSSVLAEAYVLEPKKYNIQTDVLSQKALQANIEDFQNNKQPSDLCTKIPKYWRRNGKVHGEIAKLMYNSNKEYLSDLSVGDKTMSVLVRQKEDVHCQKKFDSLTQRFKIRDLLQLKRGVVWNITIKNANFNSIFNDILDTNILHNPLSHECFRIS